MRTYRTIIASALLTGTLLLSGCSPAATNSAPKAGSQADVGGSMQSDPGSATTGGATSAASAQPDRPGDLATGGQPSGTPASVSSEEPGERERTVGHPGASGKAVEDHHGDSSIPSSGNN